MNNNSGGNIDLGEICLICEAQCNYDWYNTVLSRDVLDPVETFYDGAQLYVKYTFNLVYPPLSYEKTSTAKAQIAS
ncbi:MAG: hypothetical protein ACWGQW_00360 [bacterium]